MTGRLRRRNGRDRGAVFVEFALIVPLIMVVAMGIVEYGLAWSATNDVNAAAREAARAASSAPAAQSADQTVLQTIGGLLSGTEKDGLEKVIVFQAASANQTMPSTSCLNTDPTTGSPGSARGVYNQCNVYGPDQVNWVMSASQSQIQAHLSPPASQCSNSTYIDYHWCPINRQRSTSADNAEYVGVYIKLNHSSVTHFGFGDQTIVRSAVFRLEPAFGES